MKTIATALAATIFTAGAAHAVTQSYRIDANPINSTVPSFSLEFDDLDGDMLFSENELTAFSAFDVAGFTFSELVSAPQIDGLTDGVGTSWIFEAPPSTTFTSNLGNYAYNLTELAAVPLPASALLLLAGLGGLAAVRRRVS